MEHVKSTIDKIVAAYDARAAEAQTCLNCEWADNAVAEALWGMLEAEA